MSERLVINKGEDKLFQVIEQQLILDFVSACEFGLSPYRKNRPKVHQNALRPSVIS
jgi:hypothetical protein